MEVLGITAIICIAVLVIAIVIVLTILVYNQMLLLNEVNKRLLLLTKESIDKERHSAEELQDALIQLEQASNETQTTQSNTFVEDVTDDDAFNPHTYQDDDLR